MNWSSSIQAKVEESVVDEMAATATISGGTLGEVSPPSHALHLQVVSKDCQHCHNQSPQPTRPIANHFLSTGSKNG